MAAGDMFQTTGRLGGISSLHLSNGGGDVIAGDVGGLIGQSMRGSECPNLEDPFHRGLARWWAFLRHSEAGR